MRESLVNLKVLVRFFTGPFNVWFFIFENVWFFFFKRTFCFFSFFFINYKWYNGPFHFMIKKIKDKIKIDITLKKKKKTKNKNKTKPHSAYLFSLILRSKKKWVPVNSIGKVSDGCIRDLRFNPRLHQKLIGILV